MCVLNQIDRFNLANDVIERVPKLRTRAAYAQQAIREKLLEHKRYIEEHGDDMPEIKDWKWRGAGKPGKPTRKADTAADAIALVRRRHEEWMKEAGATPPSDRPV